MESLRATKVTREVRFVLFDQPSFSAFVQAAKYLAANSSGRVAVRIDRIPSQP
jgi:hypothetical protein